MSDECNKALLNIETHTLPDDYPFSVDELDRIIAGEVVSPHQAAIMARELKKRRQAETSTPVEDDYLANMLWYAEESVCHPDPNYQCEFGRLAAPGVIAAVIRELLQHRGFAKNNRPVVYTSRTELQCEDGFGEIWPEPILDGSDIALYLYASPSPERDQIRRDHAEWSQDTFGDVGPTGPLKHLSLEALETAEAPGNYAEWADMQFLLWDAQRRAGITDEQITRAMIEKLKVNKSRNWPDPEDGEPRFHIHTPAE